MKKVILLFSLVVVLAGFYAGRIMDERVKSLLQTLKLSENDAQNQIFSNISGPTFYFPNISALKSITVGDRAAMVEVIGNYVKDFTANENFKKRYNDYRESQKPSPPEKPKSMEELKNEQRESMKQSLEEMKTAKKDATSDMKSIYDESIKMLEEQLKQIDDPNNTMFSPEMDKYMQTAYQQQMEQYNQQVAEWEKEYPANNPNLIIKTCLNSFLEQSKEVDFSAQTATDKNRTVFVKQEYERKNYLWKLCFRAGKETTESARKFAQGWFKQL